MKSPSQSHKKDLHAIAPHKHASSLSPPCRNGTSTNNHAYLRHLLQNLPPSRSHTQKVVEMLVDPVAVCVTVTGEQGSGKRERAVQACDYVRKRRHFDAVLLADLKQAAPPPNAPHERTTCEDPCRLVRGGRRGGCFGACFWVCCRCGQFWLLRVSCLWDLYEWPAGAAVTSTSACVWFRRERRKTAQREELVFFFFFFFA